MQTRQSRQQAVSQTHGPTKQQASASLGRATHPTALIQRATTNLGALTPADVLQLQRTIGNRAVGQLLARAMQHQSIQRAQSTTTGLPDPLKSDIEALSGISMEDVKVHYNSPQPAQLNALAYTQGTDIHIAPGQEKHLPHEAWHVVQQAQGRVKPTMQMENGIQVNDDAGLEHEANLMGATTMQMGPFPNERAIAPPLTQFGLSNAVQRVNGEPPEKRQRRERTPRAARDFVLQTKYVTLRFQLHPWPKVGSEPAVNDTSVDYEVSSVDVKSDRPPVGYSGEQDLSNVQGQHKVAYLAIGRVLQRIVGQTLENAEQILMSISEQTPTAFALENISAPSNIQKSLNEARIPEEAETKANTLITLANNYLIGMQANNPSWESIVKEELKGKGEKSLTNALDEFQKIGKDVTSNTLSKLFGGDDYIGSLDNLFDITNRSSDEIADAENRAQMILKLHNPEAMNDQVVLNKVAEFMNRKRENEEKRKNTEQSLNITSSI